MRDNQPRIWREWHYPKGMYKVYHEDNDCGLRLIGEVQRMDNGKWQASIPPAVRRKREPIRQSPWTGAPSFRGDGPEARRNAVV